MSDTTTLPPYDESIETREQYEDRMARMRADMAADGVATDVPVQADYFGFNNVERVMFPDGISYVEISALNEGGRRNYQDRVNREVIISKGTGDAKMQMANGSERHILLTEAVVGWNLVRNGSPLRYSKAHLADFLTTTNPVIVDLIDKAVREQNPWLQGDVTIEDLEKQIEDLQQQIERKRKDEEGKAS